MTKWDVIGTILGIFSSAAIVRLAWFVFVECGF